MEFEITKSGKRLINSLNKKENKSFYEELYLYLSNKDNSIIIDDILASVFNSYESLDGYIDNDKLIMAFEVESYILGIALELDKMELSYVSYLKSVEEYPDLSINHFITIDINHEGLGYDEYLKRVFELAYQNKENIDKIEEEKKTYDKTPEGILKSFNRHALYGSLIFIFLACFLPGTAYAYFMVDLNLFVRILFPFCWVIFLIIFIANIKIYFFFIGKYFKFRRDLKKNEVITYKGYPKMVKIYKSMDSMGHSTTVSFIELSFNDIKLYYVPAYDNLEIFKQTAKVVEHKLLDESLRLTYYKNSRICKPDESNLMNKIIVIAKQEERDS